MHFEWFDCVTTNVNYKTLCSDGRCTAAANEGLFQEICSVIVRTQLVNRKNKNVEK